jgi:hypothetical protein
LGLDSFKNDTILNFNSTDIKNFGAPASSIQFTKELIIHLVNHALNIGFSADNIRIVFDCTQIGRNTKRIPTEFVNTILENLSPKMHSRDWGNLIYDSYREGYFKLNNNLYTTFSDGNVDKFPYEIKQWIEDETEYSNKKDIIDHIQEYVETILIIQHFLNNNNIEYSAFFMSNVIEGWYYDTFLKHSYSGIKTYNLPNLKNNFDISKISEPIKILFDTIDFDKFILHTNDNQTFGGLDEFTIDNYDKTVFKDYNLEMGDNRLGMHPNNQVQISFEETYLKPKLQSFLNK